MGGNNNAPDPAIDPSAFLAEAYALGDKEKLITFYRKWATDYDAQMAALGYLSPETVARLLGEHLDKPAGEVLDVGCGTGLTGLQATRHGVSVIDGIDLSGEMIAVARARDIYRRLVVGDLNQPLAFEDASYDAAISSGAFTHGHVGPEPLPELVRILRPGGLLACTIHFDLWHSRGFDKTLADLIGGGSLRCLSLTEGPYFEGKEHEGWFCLYQKP